MSLTDTRPVLRILHHMARSGGTVIAKCLGSMNGTVLLSEVHPHGVPVHNPLQQASDWFGLFTPDELADLGGKEITFTAAVEMIRQRVEASGRCLVLRDWSHLDFTGLPFTDRPSYRLTTAEVLGQQYEIVHTTTVRHPVDQWLSLNKLVMIRRTGLVSPEVFLRGYARFAEYASKIGFVRYEDFTRDSAATLRLLCDRLQTTYDAGYEDRWRHYMTITGDNTTPSESRLVNHTTIEPLSRQEFGPELLEAFQHNADYRKAMDLLGYADATPGPRQHPE